MKRTSVYIIIFFIFLLPLIGKKKISFEFFIGISFPNYSNLYLSENGVDNYIKHYSEYLNLKYSESGTYSQITTSIPASFVIKYQINDRFSLRGSVEYNSGTASGSKTYTIKWDDFNEEYTYSNGYKVVSLIPKLGIEYKTGRFALYVDAGINIGDVSHTTEMFYTESGITYSSKNTFKGLGTGLALSIGSKYFFKIKKIGTLILRAEIFLSSINSLPGTMNTSWVNPIDGNDSNSTEGIFYIFETNPYGTGWFEDMGFYQNIPSSDTLRSIKELTLNFSSIKLGIGYSF